MRRPSLQPPRSAVLGVWLEPTPASSTRVGSLSRDASGTVRFAVDEGYIGMGHSRPILSLSWHQKGDEEKTLARLRYPHNKTALGGRLPGWFSNLLPEGALRTLVERWMGTGAHEDFDVLAVLGEDLPGAVVIRDETGGHTDAIRRLLQEAGTPEDAHPVRFSLAGVQLKLSMSASRNKLTLPASQGEGHVIVKLPNRNYTDMPESEFSAMSLAQAAGVQTPPFRLVPLADVDLPASWRSIGQHAFVIDRFDRIRTEGGVARRHMEDFAQILDAEGDQKFTKSNEETNMNVISKFCEVGSIAVLQAVRRVVTNILVGNYDAHAKNWSMLIDGDRVSLSPAYDIFPTRLYDEDDELALAFGGTRTARLIGPNKFRRAAKRLGMDERSLENEARRTVEGAAEAWPPLLRDLPLSRERRERLAAIWDASALPRDFGVANPLRG